MKPHIVPHLLALVSVTVTTGCANTPQSALDLAEKSSANVGVVSARLDQIAADSNDLFARRVANISRLNATVTSQRAQLDYDIALTVKVGEDADIALMKDLQAWVADSNKIFSDAEAATKQRQDQLVGAQQKLDTKRTALQSVAQTLAALSKKESLTDRVKLIKDFSVEVRDDAKKQLDDGSKSSTAAKALLDKIKGSTPTVVKP